MKQSDRIRYCREYHNHPQKAEYDMKEKQILSKGGMSFFGFLCVMILVYGAIFLIGVILGLCGIGNAFVIIVTWASVGLGIINIIAIFICILYDCTDFHKSNYDELDELNKEYLKKGLIVVKEQDLYKHECCEYDDWNECFVCCVTKKRLSHQDYIFCREPGNCKYCRTFVRAYLGPDGDEYWRHEFKR